MNGYLSKPISATDLFGALTNLFSLTPKTTASAVAPRPAAPPSAAASQSAPTAPAFDLRQLQSNMDDDEDMLLDIVGAFLRDHVAQLRDLREGLTQGDEQTALRTAHTVKGLLLTLAADAAAEVAVELERLVRE